MIFTSGPFPPFPIVLPFIPNSHNLLKAGRIPKLNGNLIFNKLEWVIGSWGKSKCWLAKYETVSIFRSLSFMQFLQQWLFLTLICIFYLQTVN